MPGRRHVGKRLVDRAALRAGQREGKGRVKGRHIRQREAFARLAAVLFQHGKPEGKREKLLKGQTPSRLGKFLHIRGACTARYASRIPMSACVSRIPAGSVSGSSSAYRARFPPCGSQRCFVNPPSVRKRAGYGLFLRGCPGSLSRDLSGKSGVPNVRPCRKTDTSHPARRLHISR